MHVYCARGYADMVMVSLVFVLLMITCSCIPVKPKSAAQRPAVKMTYVDSDLDTSYAYIQWACDQLSDTSITALNLKEPGDAQVTSRAGVVSDDRGRQVFVRIGSATHLRTLVMPEDTTDQTMECLAGLSHLEILGLSKCRIKGKGLSSLAAMSRLERLAMANAWIDDEGLSHLPPLPNLLYLSIGGNPITPLGLRNLTSDRFPRLTRLSLNGRNIDDSWVPELLKVEHLVELDLFESGLTDKGFLELAKHASLREIAVANSFVTDKGWSEFHKRRPEVNIQGKD